jgi:hypothetical protein
MEVKVSAMGAIKEVTEVLSVVPLGEIDLLKVKRVGLTGERDWRDLLVLVRGG